MRGFIAGAFALIALQVVISTPLAGLLGAAAAPAQWARAWMDPTVPLIPPRGTAAASSLGNAGGTLNTTIPPGVGSGLSGGQSAAGGAAGGGKR